MKRIAVIAVTLGLGACGVSDVDRASESDDGSASMRPPVTISTPDNPAATLPPPPPSENAGATDRQTPAAADEATP